MSLSLRQGTLGERTEADRSRDTPDYPAICCRYELAVCNHVLVAHLSFRIDIPPRLPPSSITSSVLRGVKPFDYIAFCIASQLPCPLPIVSQAAQRLSKGGSNSCRMRDTSRFKEEREYCIYYERKWQFRAIPVMVQQPWSTSSGQKFARSTASGSITFTKSCVGISKGSLTRSWRCVYNHFWGQDSMGWALRLLFRLFRWRGWQHQKFNRARATCKIHQQHH